MIRHGLFQSLMRGIIFDARRSNLSVRASLHRQDLMYRFLVAQLSSKLRYGLSFCRDQHKPSLGTDIM